MRLGALWGAAALALLAVASVARTTQVDGATRGRRLQTPSPVESSDLANATKDAEPTYRIRGSRRKEEMSAPTRDVSRTRGRPAPTPTTDIAEVERTQTIDGRNERFDSRRTRTRNGPVENEATVSSSTDRTNVIRNRSRFSQQRQSSPKSLVEASSERNDVIDNSSMEKTPSDEKEDIPVTNQFRRRSFLSQTTEKIIPTQFRGRYIRKNNGRSLDLTDVGTTNTVTVLGREPTTARSNEDVKVPRKLRYKTRLSEVDTNLTGEGLVNSNDKVNKESESTESNLIKTEQSADSLRTPNVPEKISSKPESPSFKITRRVPVRGKGGYKPSFSTAAPKISDEVSEDDNYPESFKALLQAKSASTQANSPDSESLSVKASQTVFKTYIAPSQSTDTDITSTKDLGFKRKSEIKEHEESISNDVTTNTTKTLESKSRTLFKPRSRKISSFSTTPKALSTSETVSVTENPSRKYNRRLKFTTTHSPKLDKSKDKEELRSKWKKPLIRQSYISRRKPEGNESAEIVEDALISPSLRKSKPTRNELLSKYSRGNRYKSTSTEASKINEMVDQSSTEKIADNTDNMPFVITLLSSTENNGQDSVTDKTSESSVSNGENNIFIIAVSSTESVENKVNYHNSAEEQTGNRPYTDVYQTTSKYNSNFKTPPTESTQVPIVSTSPEIKKLHIRNQEHYHTATQSPEHPTVQKYRGRYNRKYEIENKHKTTDSASNVITPEPDRVKSRYSSKYRASHGEKPIYKATVPTVTPSTAWLKFFVTDHLLTKTAEEPIWFDEADFYTTEPMPRQFVTSSPYIHEPPLQLVEGEEIQLGPNTNAFSIMQTQRPLSSANLRLSESLEKPLHIMNVEASQHSPSVTVSIFGALADVLTSTPRTPRLSSTTDVSQNNYVDVKESLVDVSNTTDVNSTEDLTSQHSYLNKEVNTVQTTANVINNLSEGDLVAMSISTNNEVIPTYFQSTTPNPTSTTPISARRPFAFKILYSNTATPTDNIRTASTINQVSTDSPTPTVSDILIPSSNLISSELTSMLTNNIRDILQNMDASNKNKVSVDMARLLKSLIPKALDRRTTALDDLETLINTTPFSLEEIRDTQNVDTGIVDLPDTNNLQSESSESLVNSTVEIKDGFVSNYTNEVLVSNNSFTLNASNQISSAETSKNDFINTTEIITTTASPLSDIITEDESGLSDKNINISVTEKSTTPNKVYDENRLKKQSPVPFFTNSQVQEIDDIETSLDNLENPLVKSLVTPIQDIDAIDSVDTNSSPMQTQILPTQQVLSNDGQSSVQISPIQLWVLSRKAKVLQMIEELLRQHNDEIATVPLSGLVSSTDDVQLSNRLTKILDVMNGTVDMTSDSRQDDLRPDDTVPTPTVPSFYSYSITPFMHTSTDVSQFGTIDSGDTTTEKNINENFYQVTTPTVLNDEPITSTATPVTNTYAVTQKTESDQENFETTTSSAPMLSTATASIQSFDSSIDVKLMTENTNFATEEAFTTEGKRNTLFISSNGLETTTNAVLFTENTTIQKNTNIDTTTENSTPAETITPQEPTNSINEIATTINSNVDFSLTTENSISSDTSIQANTASSETAIPKKDYVIFGILPNNTVVRKDPNDDILETLTEASPYIIYGVLPNNTIIRRFPNGTRVPRVMQKIDVLSISPWSLKNPYSPIHNNPAIVRPKSNPTQTNTITETPTNALNNGNENKLTNDTVNNLQNMIPPSTVNVNGSSSFDITRVTNKPPAEKSTASHVLSLRTSTTLPSVDEILLNSISSAIKEDMVLSEQKMSTDETRILTLDIDPETKKIRTEKPGDGNEGAIFKFIPVDEITVTSTDTNVLKITSTKSTPSTTVTTTSDTITESQEKEISESPTTVSQGAFLTTEEQNNIFSSPSTTEVMFEINEKKTDATFVDSTTTSTEIVTTDPTITSTHVTTTTLVPTITTPTALTTTVSTTTEELTTPSSSSVSTLPTTSTAQNKIRTTNIPTTVSTSFPIQSTSEINNYEDEGTLLSSFQKNTERNPKNLNGFPMQFSQSGKKQQENLINALLQANSNSNKVKTAPTTPRSLEEDLRQLEEDTKLLKALLAATGQDPSKLNLPSIGNFNIASTSAIKTTTTSPTEFTSITTTFAPSTQSADQAVFEDDKLLTQLLQGTEINNGQLNKPLISGKTSHVRFASNLRTTTRNSNPTTPYNIRPVYTTTTTVASTTQTTLPTIVSLNELQQEIVTEEIGGISTTYTPKFTTSNTASTRRTQSRRFTTTTEVPSTSTFSVQEDLLFLQNLKTVLKTSTNDEDPEAALANRIIALAVERSLNEIQTGNQTVRTENSIAETTAAPTTTTTLRTTTTPPTTTTQTQQTPSLEEDIKQFEEDTKLLKALIQATGQDPSAFNIPTLPSIITTTTVSSTTNKFVTNSLSSRTLKPSKPSKQQAIITTATDQTTISTAAIPFGAKIAVKDNLKTVKEDEKLLKTLVKLQGVQETTTQKLKLAVTGQTRDEALNTLIKQKKPAVMISEATKSPMSLSTEYGKSKDALLAALLKEQGFGPTTASSLDEQQRLTALLNQVVVTPKARRTTTLPPPPPPQRRPILDGLAWLWQQWQETGPGPGGSRPRKPASSPTASSASGGGQRVNWFGSGPFIGNADDGSSSNRIPLEPPHAVTSQQAPGRGQLVSAAINVTRAFSQFLGAAIQGAAQTVQSVFRAGQRVAADAYTNGSGGSG